MSRSNLPAAPIRSATPRLLAVGAAAVAACALAACGGNSPSSPAAAEQSGERAAEVKLARFAKCLREHGIETKTSSGPGHEAFGVRVKGGGGPGKMEAAQRACARYRPEAEKVKLSPQEKVAREEAVLKFAKCMREHGIDVHASTADGGVQIRIGGPGPGPRGPDPESPAFQAAQKACQSLLPLFKHGPAGSSGAGVSRSPGPGSGAVGVGG